MWPPVLAGLWRSVLGSWDQLLLREPGSETSYADVPFPNLPGEGSGREEPAFVRHTCPYRLWITLQRVAVWASGLLRVREKLILVFQAQGSLEACLKPQWHSVYPNVSRQPGCWLLSSAGSLCSTHRDDNVQRELRDWGLSFDSNLLSFSGRILQSEKIHQGGKTVRLSGQFWDKSHWDRRQPYHASGCFSPNPSPCSGKPQEPPDWHLARGSEQV